MVGFISEPTIEEDLDQPSKLNNLKETLDPSDTKIKDFSFADSFLDFDSLKEWFEGNPNPDRFSLGDIEFGAVEKSIVMGDDDFCGKTHVEEQISHGSGPIVGGSKPVVDGVEPIVGGSGCMVEVEVKVKVEECEKEGNVGSCIEKEMEKVSLVGVKESGVKSESEVESESSEESESESESESSSLSSSSSDDDDHDEEEEEEEKEEVKVEVKREEGEIEEGEIRGEGEEEMVGWSDHDDSGEEEEMVGGSDFEFDDVENEDEDGGATGRPIRSKNELQDLPPVPVVDVTLQPHHQTLPVGVVLSIIDAKVIVEGVEKHNPLNEGSILWITESRSPLGLVDEIFGPVKNPYYVVRYNSESEVPAGIHEGTSVSFVTEFANHVLNDKNLYKKGYDASNENDEELSDEAEFSDDEKEAEYRRMQKMAKRGMNDQNPGNKKNNRKKGKNRDGRWKNDRHSVQQTSMGAGQLPPNQNQHHVSAVAMSLAGNNCPSSSAVGPGFVGGAGLVPPFPPVAQPTGIITPSNGVWTNGMPYQPPQNAVFPNGFPNNGIPWFSQNHQQYPYQMPMPNLMFQQQFDHSQRSLPNVVLPGGQSNFFAAPNAPWPGPVGQNFNQTAFGMGLQGQPTHPSTNAGQQGIQQPAVILGNTEAPPQFNLGSSSNHSRKPYHRGGGHSARGRGRQQSK